MEYHKVCGREGRLSDGKSQCYLSIYRSVGQSVSQSVGQSVSHNQSVGKQSVRKEGKNVFGQLVRLVIMSEKEGSRRLYKYRKAR